VDVRRTAVARWTGRGSIGALRGAASRRLAADGIKAKVGVFGGSIVVEGPEPLRVATMLGTMPGVAWVGAGVSVSSVSELSAATGSLAKKYLRKGGKFSVLAEAGEGMVRADLASSATSSVLDSVKGTRVDEEAPQVRFRVAFDGSLGVAGVELANGPGGAPPGKDVAACLVSGGKHSSVVAWMAMLSGFRVKLVHARVDGDALKEVARLYLELSQRGDPGALSLEVLEGADPASELGSWSKENDFLVFVGSHAGCSGFPPGLGQRAKAPLFVLSEERFDAEYKGLELRGVAGATGWRTGGGGRFETRRFAGAVGDVSQVIDGLGRRPPRS
jgi:hypothetical protein